MKNREQITVIKLGGHAMENPDLLTAFCEDVATLTRSGHKLVIAHGGGPAINQLLDRLNIKSEFTGGLRITDAATLEVVELALCGQVNKYLTRHLLACGVDAAGISGEDGHLLTAVRKDEMLGFVGKVTKVNPALPLALLKSGFTPVIAPLALASDGQVLNVNADTAAGAIAGALGADYFLLISDVPGVLDQEGQLIATLDNGETSRLISEKIITGGMIPKVECCRAALGQGCAKAIILDGSRKNTLSLCLESDDIAGTVISEGCASPIS